MWQNCAYVDNLCLLRKLRMKRQNLLKLPALFAFFLMVNFANAQITLQNPSFEDEPADATTPMGWFPCEEGTTPDILPGYWGVYQEANDGDTFVGIITRESGTYESIGQRTSDVMEKGSCYEFSLDLAHSDNYAGYTGALQLRIYIGAKKCKTSQLIFESPVIEDEDWQEFEVEFTPEKNSEYIIIEAFHKDGKFSFKGNILIDNFSPIKICSRA